MEVLTRASSVKHAKLDTIHQILTLLGVSLCHSQESYMKNDLLNSNPEVLNVLLVDDDADWREILKSSLQGLGSFTVSESADAAGALAMLQNTHFHIVMADIHLKGINGFELAQEIRKERMTTPEIVFISGDPRVSIFEAHQVGACHVLRKPVDLEELATLMNRLRNEQRRNERVVIDPKILGRLYGKVSMHNGLERVEVELGNLGRGGFFFHVSTDRALPEPGSVVEFQVSLGMVPNAEILGKGIVRWTKNTAAARGAGVEFLEIPAESQRLVNAFVDLFKVRPFVPDQS
jgi:CheY-like chemotaxis protein